MNKKLFESWLLYQQILFDIENIPLYSYTNELLKRETRADKKAIIIKKHIKMYNLKINTNE